MIKRTGIFFIVDKIIYFYNQINAFLKVMIAVFSASAKPLFCMTENGMCQLGIKTVGRGYEIAP